MVLARAQFHVHDNYIYNVIRKFTFWQAQHESENF